MLPAYMLDAIPDRDDRDFAVHTVRYHNRENTRRATSVHTARTIGHQRAREERSVQRSLLATAETHRHTNGHSPANTTISLFTNEDIQHGRSDRVDSEMLVEEGFSVVSVDASDKMLKYALKTRWNRRKEPVFDRWVIEEGNWLSLDRDIAPPAGGFDAVFCLGNSFAHLPDFKGDQSDQRLALRNIAGMVRPGGILIIDHRNYDYILNTGCAPQGKNIYYKSDLTQDITTSILWVNNKAHMVTLDYTVQVPYSGGDSPDVSQFRLSYYPHRLDAFSAMLREAFGGSCEHMVYGDFLPYSPGQEREPCYFIHVAKRTA